MILRVVEGWMENSERSLLDISPELQEALVDMLETEKDEELRLRIKVVLCNINRNGRSKYSDFVVKCPLGVA